MRKKTLLILMGASAVLMFSAARMGGADIVVIGNRALGVDKLSVSEVQAIWLGHLVKIGRITPVAADLPAKDEVRKDFLRDVLGLTLLQFRVRRTKLAFTTQRPPPKVFPNEASVREWVAANPVRVGYLRPEMADGTVQVLLRVKN